MEPEVGYCRGKFPRYFYNSTSGRCEKFIYGGCGGNENNFMILDDCQIECGKLTIYKYLDKVYCKIYILFLTKKMFC